ncbi:MULTISPECIES: stressosome-associated protein Prli42 [Marinococcus]|nr:MULTISPECIES: stressosome-associated protein Prli42 [Marinococcus]MDX6153235.1 stressosome-associated protein Prli42 [Marinococcus sp. PL1-022]
MQKVIIYIMIFALVGSSLLMGGAVMF